MRLNVGVSLKKTTRYRERSYTQRVEYLRTLRQLIPQYGIENIVYFDESGFEEHAFNPYARGLKGQKIYADKTGNHKKNRTNLIMAHRQKKWLAPVLFTGSCTHQVVEEWLEHHLFRELKKPSVIIADNAQFHRKKALEALAERHGHKMLFLPPYSPDLNPIEQDFAVIKQRRYRETLEDILCGNCFK